MIEVGLFNKKKNKEESTENIESVDFDEQEKEESTPTVVLDEEKKDEDSPEVVEKPKKKFKLFQTFNIYKFIVKIIATVLLITLGILILVFQDQAMFAIFIITGGIALFQAIIRAFFLLKKTRNKKAKIVTAVELGIQTLIGLFLIFAAFATLSVINTKDGEEPNKFFINVRDFANDQFTLFAALLLFVGALSYYWRTILLKDETDNFKFWLNFFDSCVGILFCIFYKNKDFEIDARVIAIIIAVLAFLSALVIGGEAIGGYMNYRRLQKPKTEEKKDEKEEKPEIEAPGKDDDIDYSDIDPNTIPVNDDNNHDSIIS